MIKTRNHEATATSRRETYCLKLAVKPSRGWGASRQAVTRVNANVASKNLTSGSRACHIEAKATQVRRYLVKEPMSSGGVAATAWTAEDISCDWRGPTHPGNEIPEEGRSYNLGYPGKWTGDGRASEGLIRARMEGNASGAKGPCWQTVPLTKREARAR